MRTLAPLLLALIAGCGGAEISHDDLTRDDAALRAHQYHEDLVQLAGDRLQAQGVFKCCDSRLAYSESRVKQHGALPTDIDNRQTRDDHDEENA